jgi:hypothetical protein
LQYLDKVVSLFKEVLKLFKGSKENFEASGRHNTHDFAAYCYDDCNLLWLFDWLEFLNNPELTMFCAEGSIIDTGFDTANDRPVTTPPSGQGTSSSSDASSSSGKKRGVGANMIKELARGNDIKAAAAMTMKRKADERMISDLYAKIDLLEDQFENFSEEVKLIRRGERNRQEFNRVEALYLDLTTAGVAAFVQGEFN